MEYEVTLDSYLGYVEKCRNIIRDSFFSEKDTEDLDIVNKEKLEIDQIVKRHRLKMIDIKLDHTMRMIEQIININNNLGIKINLGLVIKIATLYHDVGRIRQSTWCNTFKDNIYRRMNRPFCNHSEEGYDIFLNNSFYVDERYIPIIGQIILHHQDLHTIPKLNYRFSGELDSIDVDKIVTGSFSLNEAEWQIVSLIVQLVADVDKTDILYQHLLNDFEMIRDYVYDYSGESIDSISKRWGVSKLEIIEFNDINSFDYRHGKVKVPIKNMPLEKLEVPEYMKSMFYDNTWPELKVLIQDRSWNFISILWWRLSHFLNQISFRDTLANIEESNLLEQIYIRIPDRLKPLVEEAFDYAKDVLVFDRLEKNKGNIYLKK